MAKKDIKAALKNSILIEENAVENRFKKAETLFGDERRGDAPAEPEKRQKELPKVIRDSFTMPQADYELITTLKNRSLSAGISTTKSEILRAGLLALDQMTEADFLNKIGGVEKIKTGRPKQTL